MSAKLPRPSRPSVRATSTWRVKLASACVPWALMAPRASLLMLVPSQGEAWWLDGACDVVVVAHDDGRVGCGSRDVALDADGGRDLERRGGIRRRELPLRGFRGADGPHLRLEGGGCRPGRAHLEHDLGSGCVGEPGDGGVGQHCRTASQE